MIWRIWWPMKVKTIGFMPLLFVGACAQAQIVDSHFHLFSEENIAEIRARSGGQISAPVSFQNAASLLDQAGVDSAMALSGAYLLSDRRKAMAENDFVAGEARKSGGRLIPFCSISLETQWDVAELDRCFAELGMRGIKLHPQANRFDLSDKQNLETLKSILERLKALQLLMNRKLPIVIDSNWLNREITGKVFHLMGQFPELNLVLAHALVVDWRDLELLAFYYEILPNVTRNLYLDLSATGVLYQGSPDSEQMRWVLRKFGIDRVLMGSDYPVHSPKQALEALESYGFTEEEMLKIRGSNALGLWQ